MYQTIVDAMHSLGGAGLIFGLENSQKGENEFQGAFGRALERMTQGDGWRWRYSHHYEKEERFKTEALTNVEEIAFDVVGRHNDKGTVAIELKYIMGKPKDQPALPYDVAKDCLKLDLLRSGLCFAPALPSALPDPEKLQTYVVALTNWSRYWEGKRSKGWSANFANALKANGKPVCFEGLLRTNGKPEVTIFTNRRCHIAFGQEWTGEWRQYSSTGEAKAFSYLLLHPASEAKPEWTHQHMSINEQSEIIPFLNTASREEFKRRKRNKQD
ncbi:hypothetical protein KUL72_04365 [Bradyrhizobium arachidis]|uniref:hypothetical protein n=1 Tax=Bradyrhizobium arachidis TaxID=858423 RepID=UPI002161BE1E|nr:hypothetical protein [Bradyrhizobium arachidis]UVO37631.1 hypothetical protein KUL72_04365 [Bradyrhizobium arachidis]